MLQLRRRHVEHRKGCGVASPNRGVTLKYRDPAGAFLSRLSNMLQLHPRLEPQARGFAFAPLSSVFSLARSDALPRGISQFSRDNLSGAATEMATASLYAPSSLSFLRFKPPPRPSLVLALTLAVMPLAPTARFRPRRDAMRKDAFAEPGCEMAGDRNYEAKKRLCCKDVTGGQNLRL